MLFAITPNQLHQNLGPRLAPLHFTFLKALSEAINMFTMRTFIKSAYRSALLVSCAALISYSTTLAATINPQGLQSMAVGMGISMPGSAATDLSALVADAMVSDTPLTYDALIRLREYALAAPRESHIVPKAAKLLGLEGYDQGVPVKQFAYFLSDGKRYFSVSTKQNSDDIVFSIRPNETTLIMYLTSSKLVLRAALVVEPGNSHLITNEQAAAGFKALLEFWAEKSKTLPPHP
jgi:hypothetical protein